MQKHPGLHQKATEKKSTTLVVTERDTKDDIYIVFSTSCTDQQDWESYVLFFHCWRLRQPGSVTRIASGCNEEKAAKLEEFHRNFIETLSPNFHLHLTPDFSRTHLEKEKHPYKYNNKPYGLLHWLENGPQKGNLPDSNDLLVLMDPDMILLRPIISAAAIADDESLLWVENESSTKEERFATYGPVAQQDGYLTNSWMPLVPKILSPNRTQPAYPEGPVRWNAGPPYFGTIRDWHKLTKRWTELAGPVLSMHPHLFSEMFSLILAAVDLQKPFRLAAGFVVSTTASSNREGWQWVDDLSDPCATAQQAVRRGPTDDSLPTLPYMLHYCKRYGTGRYFFSKYRVKKNIVSCEAPLMAYPDANATASDFIIFPPRADGKDKATFVETPKRIPARQSKRETFMVCGMTAALNEALLQFKKQACKGKSANMNNTYLIMDDPRGYHPIP